MRFLTNDNSYRIHGLVQCLLHKVCTNLFHVSHYYEKHNYVYVAYQKLFIIELSFGRLHNYVYVAYQNLVQ